MKKMLPLLVFGLLFASAPSVLAQREFWGFDDEDNEAPIPPECDGSFDENRGGVYVPTAEEMYTHGEAFLIDSDPEVRRKAGFCLIGAAVQGYVPAQYRVAQLYAKGFVLPQDDLSAYRWAFLASLNGNEDASRLALTLERFLTTQDIELATKTLDNERPIIAQNYRADLSAQNARVDAKKAELDKLNREIDKMLGIKTPEVSPRTQAQKQASKATPRGSIFTDSDRQH